MQLAKAVRRGVSIAGRNDQPLTVPLLPVFRLRPLFEPGNYNAPNVTFGIVLERHGSLGPLKLVDLTFVPGCAFYICPLVGGKDYSVIREPSAQGDLHEVIIETISIHHDHFLQHDYKHLWRVHGYFDVYSGNPNLIQFEDVSPTDSDESN